MKILVAYDDTDAAKRALERAADIAEKWSGELSVVSVSAVAASAAARSIGSDPTDTTAEHLQELGAARTYLEGRGQSASYIEATGHVADAIIAAADEHDVDLIVIGTRDIGTVQRLLGASVSDSVSRNASCDVLIVR